jgi:hypothetical protein
MSLISRIWQYLVETTTIEFPKEQYRIGANGLFFPLERYLRDKNMSPVTRDEKNELIGSIRKWRAGQSTKSILKELDMTIGSAANATPSHTRRQREAFGNRGSLINTPLKSRADYLRKIKKYLEELFNKNC